MKASAPAGSDPSMPDNANDVRSVDPTPSVAVFGLGLMGTAVASTLVDSGVPVTVWNRSPEKCSSFRDTASVAATAAGAIAGSQVGVFVLADYSVTETVLRDCGESLQGRTVVNLCTGSPDDARRVASLVDDLGATYLDGAIEAYPSEIGDDKTLISYCGARSAWEKYRPLLIALAGRSHYLSADPAAANVADAALAGAFYNGSLGAFHEAVAFADATGVALPDIKASIDYWIDMLRRHAHAAIDAVIADDYSTDQATLDVYLVAARTWLDTIRTSGQSARILAAYADNLQEASAAGVGAQSLTAQVGVLQHRQGGARHLSGEHLPR